jgi:hypothetical protein
MELGVVVTTATAYVLPGVPSLEARLRPAGTWRAENCFPQRTSFLAKQGLQPKHTTGNEQATVTSAVLSWTELSAEIKEIVTGLTAGSCECNNEPLIQRKVGEFFDQGYVTSSKRNLDYAGSSHITRGDGVANKAQTREMFRHYIHHLLGTTTYFLSHNFDFKVCLLI